MSRILGRLVVGTLLALGCVQQRVSLVTAGYEVESLRRLREELIDQNRVLHYNVLTLQSPVILNRRLERQDIQLTPPQHVEILQPPLVQMPSEGPGKTALKTRPAWMQQAKAVVVRWFDGGRQAEAKPVQEYRETSSGM